MLPPTLMVALLLCFRRTAAFVVPLSFQATGQGRFAGMGALPRVQDAWLLRGTNSKTPRGLFWSIVATEGVKFYQNYQEQQKQQRIKQRIIKCVMVVLGLILLRFAWRKFHHRRALSRTICALRKFIS